MGVVRCTQTSQNLCEIPAGAPAPSSGVSANENSLESNDKCI